MGYVAVKGGTAAIENAERFRELRRLAPGGPPPTAAQVRGALYLAVDRVMGEGSLYAPELAALALKQAAGDSLEAAFILRAYRTTLPRRGETLPIETGCMRILRRISAAFKEIPGGQVLGPTADYSLRLLDFELDRDPRAARERLLRELRAVAAEPLPEEFPKVIDLLRREGLLVQGRSAYRAPERLVDLTREALTFPAPRSARLQALARGETGGLLALAYSNMRGYGSVHPVIGELRVGAVPVRIRWPEDGREETIGEIFVTEAEVIARLGEGEAGARFGLGYGLCFGHNETKAIAMAVLDRAMDSEEPASPSEDEEFVLTHVDGIESMGFCNHYKLPHYVTFQSDLDRLRAIRGGGAAAKGAGRDEA